MHFQRVSPPVKDKEDSTLNTGWVHRDSDYIAAGVVYLTPDADPSTGTGIYTDSQDFCDYENNRYRDSRLHDCKTQTYGQNFDDASIPHLEKVKQTHEEKFESDVTVSNRYNRLIAYGEQYPHKQQYLGSKVGDGERLTLVFFLRDLWGVNSPLLRKYRGV